MHLQTKSWYKYFSPRLIVETEGKAIPCEQYKDELRFFQTIFPSVSVEYEYLIQNGRSVASVQHPTGTDKWGNKNRGDCIIIVEFGEEGTEDEHRIVHFRECMRIGKM